MCFQTIPVLSQPRSKNTRRRQRNPANLCPIATFYYTSFFLCGSLELPVSCQQSWLHFCFFLTIHTQHLGLDWDLDSSRRLSNPGCSLSQFLFLSHPKASWPGWGHWSAHWKYSTHSPLGNHNSFESHAITVTAPIKLQIVVIYRPPGQILATFLEEGCHHLPYRTFRRNLRSLSPSLLSSVVSSSLPSPTHLTSLDVNAATDTLCSTLTSCLDDICPLSSTPARAAPSNPWLSDVLREHRTKLRAAEKKWRKSTDPSDLTRYQSLLSSFSTEVHTAKSSHFHNKINSAPDMRNLFRTFNSLLCPPPPPPTTSITADDFATFFTDKN